MPEFVDCPYCGEQIDLLDCPIVATADEGSTYPDALGLVPNRMRGFDASEFAVLAASPAQRHADRAPVGRLRKALRARPALPALYDDAEPSALPARLCANHRCQRPLPVDIDVRDVFTIAVVGSQRTGKSHFLASMIEQGRNQELVRRIGWRDFSPDELSDRRVHDMWHTLYEEGLELIGTPPLGPDEEPTPIVLRVTPPQPERPFLLMFYDLSGEQLTSHVDRTRVAPFLSWADAIVCMVDPRFIRSVGAGLERDGEFVETYNQADLINAITNECKRAGTLEQIPIAITLSKADLIERDLPSVASFDVDYAADIQSVLAQVDGIGDAVRDLLEEETTGGLLLAAEQIPRVSFHAISALGRHPTAGSQIDPAPYRCLDPIIGVMRNHPRYRRIFSSPG